MSEYSTVVLMSSLPLVLLETCYIFCFTDTIERAGQASGFPFLENISSEPSYCCSLVAGTQHAFTIEFNF